MIALKKYLFRTHPIVYPTLAITLLVYVVTAFRVASWTPAETRGMGNGGPLTYAFLLELSFFFWLLIMAVFLTFAFIGARVGEKSFWFPFLMEPDARQQIKIRRELLVKNFRQQPLSYLNVLRWVAKGIGISILFFVWTLWRHAVLGVGRFLLQLFKLIHSEKRVLCGVDGMLGGAASYLWLAFSANSLLGQVILVAFGGLLGAALGILNWEIVSKRILKIAPVSS